MLSTMKRDDSRLLCLISMFFQVVVVICHLLEENVLE